MTGRLSELLLRHAPEDAVKRGLRYLAALPPDFLAGAEPGFSRRDEIEGDALFAIHQCYRTKPHAEARLEAHRRYIDIQYLHRGEEAVRLARLASGRPLAPFDKGADVGFFAADAWSVIRLERGMAAIFLPTDLHAPCLHADGESIVLKTVVKAAVG